ncbi:MAG: hypothetical protein FWD80_06215, partial [Propionibacteriaceae bacterium]|nr:hypothetical protein [Propionibacteriaceae bacterium]
MSNQATLASKQARRPIGWIVVVTVLALVVASEAIALAVRSSGTASPTVSTSPPTVTVTVTSGQPAMTASYVFGGTDDDAFNAV